MSKKPSGGELATQFLSAAAANLFALIPTHLSPSAAALYCALLLLLLCLLIE